MKQPESVAGALFSPDRSEVLLVERRDVPVWVLPGGGIETGETPEEAIVREIKEETGFRIEIIRLVGAYIPINRLARHTHLYECALLGGEARCSEETRDVRFFPLAALPELVPPPYREWIADAEKREGPPVEKKLTGVNYTALGKHFLCHPLLVLRFLLARMGYAINDTSDK